MTSQDQQPIYILDDDDAVRDSLEVLLGNRGFKVRTFGSPAAFLDRLGELTERSCLLLDIRMPGMDGIEVLTRIKTTETPLAIVMITGHADVPTAVKAMKTGAVDFIEKPFTEDSILTAIAKAFESLQELQPTTGEIQQIKDRMAVLSPRERDVFDRLVDGLTNKEIARQLEISPRTVEIYRAGVMEKMSARNLSALVKMGLAVGLGKPL